jgi:muconate cycloisomerase
VSARARALDQEAPRAVTLVAERRPIGAVTLTAFPLALPLLSPMTLASERITHAETLVVRAADGSGEEGWGEAAAAPTMTGETIEGMAAALTRFLGPALRAAEAEPPVQALWRMGRAIRGNSGAKAAAEAAVLDLLARRAGLPLAAYLGTALRDEAPALLMIGGGTAEAALATAEAGQRQGYRHFKLKVGLGPVEQDVATVRALRAALGPGAHLSADANMAWSVAQTRAFASALGPGMLDYLEQPVGDDDLAGMAAVQAVSPFPLCLDEGLHGLEDIDRAADLSAAGGIGLKTLKLGGPLGVLAADARCSARGLARTLACKIAETSIGAAIAAHLSLLLADASWGVSITATALADDPVAERVLPETGMIRPPLGPGLGVRPDPERLARHAVPGLHLA